MLFGKVLCVSGCRNYDDWETFESEMLKYAEEIGLNPDEDKIITGSLNGTDGMAATFAQKYGYEWEVHYAEWKKYGKSAGPTRNRKMLKFADFLIAFHDGHSKGTGNAIEIAGQYKIPTRVIKIPEQYSRAVEMLKEIENRKNNG